MASKIENYIQDSCGIAMDCIGNFNQIFKDGWSLTWKKERKWKTLVTTADPARRAVVQRQAMCNTLRLQGRITATSRYFSSLWTDFMFSNIAPDRGLCHKTLLFKTMKTHHWVLSLHRIFFQECIDTAPHWYWKNCPRQRSFHLVLGWSPTHSIYHPPTQPTLWWPVAK